MNEQMIWGIVMLCANFVSSLSQILLKKSSSQKHKNRMREYCNPFVLSAYAIYGCMLILSFFSLRVLPLAWIAILESSLYVFVPILSAFFFKEKMTRKKMIAIFIIIIGVIICSL